MLALSAASRRRGGYVPSPEDIKKTVGNPFLSNDEAMQQHMDGRVTLADIEHKKEKDALVNQNALLLNDNNKLYEMKRLMQTPQPRLNIYSVDPYPALSRYYEKQDIQRAVLDEIERKNRERREARQFAAPRRASPRRSKSPAKRAKSKPKSKPAKRAKSKGKKKSKK